jgi:hypothetical protein
VDVDVNYDGEWAAAIMVDLIENCTTWSLNDASDRMFKDDPLVIAERLVGLYLALDKYDMAWALKAFHMRLEEDVLGGLVKPSEAFRAYREHPGIARLLVGVADDSIYRMNLLKGGRSMPQLRTQLLDTDLKCALIVSMGTYEPYCDSDDRHHNFTRIICKIPKDLHLEDIPERVRGLVENEIGDRDRDRESYAGKWLMTCLHGPNQLVPECWLFNDYEGAHQHEQTYVLEGLNDVYRDLRSLGNVGAFVKSNGEVVYKADAFELHKYESNY